jgi:hypothetical protein
LSTDHERDNARGTRHEDIPSDFERVESEGVSKKSDPLGL